MTNKVRPINKTQTQGIRSKGLPYIHLISIMIMLVLLVLYLSFSVFNVQTRIAQPWLYVLSITLFLLATVFILLQWFFFRHNQQLATSRELSYSNINSFSYGNFSLVNDVTYRNIINNPLQTNSGMVQQREKLVIRIYTELLQHNTTAIALTGIAGVGKSTLAALVYQYAEEQRREGKGLFTAKAQWLSISENITISDLTATIFTALEKPIPNLDKLSPQNQAVALFNALNNAEKPRLIILDQFDNLLDRRTGYCLYSGIKEWLDAINSQQCNSRLLLTTQLLPIGTRTYPLIHMREILCKGLTVDEGAELLRKAGVQALDKDLQTAVENCGGHSHALTLLAQLLHERNLSLTNFLETPNYTQVWAEDIALNLFDRIYLRQLDQIQRSLLQAFFVYREPVSFSAARAAMEDDTHSTSRIQIGQALDAILYQHLLQASGDGLYQPHIIVSTYLQFYLEKREEWTHKKRKQEAHAKAANYYMQLATSKCPQREKRREIKDVLPYIEAVWHKCQAELYDDAYRILEEQYLFDDLKRWGGNFILLELYQLLLPLEKWHPDSSQRIQININLARVHRTLGQREQALECLEKSLSISRAIGDLRGEGQSLAFQGRIYSNLGQKERAREYYKKALELRRKIGDHEGEGWTLDDMSQVYDDLGMLEPALHYAELALRTRQEQGDRRGEGRTLNTLGRVYDSLGDEAKASEYYRTALSILIQQGDRGGEGATRHNLALIYNKLGEKKQAKKYYEEALHIFEEIGDRAGECTSLDHLGLVYNNLGQKEQAKICLEKALNIRMEIGDRWGESTTRNNLGNLLLELGQKEQAREYFKEAVDIQKEVKNYKGIGVTLTYLGEVNSKLGQKKKARQHYEEALQIFKEIGDRSQEGRTLNDLGRINSVLGKMQQAFVYLNQALHIFKEEGDRSQEGKTLNSLGLIYSDLGQKQKALESLEEALSIFKKQENHKGEGRTLNNIGSVHSSMGRDKNALDYYESSLRIRKEIRDIEGEATTFNNLGRTYIELGQLEKGQKYLQEALSIFREIKDRWGEGRAYDNLGRLNDKLGEKELALTYFKEAHSILKKVGDRRGKARVFNSQALIYADQQPEKALKILENALRICQAVNDRKAEGWTLHNLGRVYSKLGEMEHAQNYFERALTIRRDVEDRKGEGWTLYNIGMILSEQSRYDIALACFLHSLRLFDDLQNPDRDKILRQIEDLRKKVGEKYFINLEAAIEPQASLIIESFLNQKLDEK